MNSRIMKGICWMSLEMGSTLNYITLEPSSLGMTFCILVYLSVYTSFSLCHRLAYQFFPWLAYVNGVFDLPRRERGWGYREGEEGEKGRMKRERKSRRGVEIDMERERERGR